jgi:hypothetical protein
MRILVPSLILRPTKRLLLFASELGFLVLGLAIALAIASQIAFANECYNSVECPVASAVLVAGVVLTIVGFVLLRRKTRSWKIEYDAIGWALTREERKLHPTHARYKRIAVRIMVWVPSMIAALVLFFLPVATHLLHPNSQYLTHYRVPIPWSTSVFAPYGPQYSYVLAISSSVGKGRFGVTPFLDSRQLTSEMHFGSMSPDAGTFELNLKYARSRREGGDRQLRRDFRLGDIDFTCWQYVHPHRYPRVGPSATEPLWWNIECGTPVDARQRNLYAWFFGREEDIPTFYRIIEGVSPLK